MLERETIVVVGCRVRLNRVKGWFGWLHAFEKIGRSTATFATLGEV
jgi:hypothetical protein